MSLAIQRGLLLFMVENLIRNTIGLKRGLGGGDDYAGLGRIPCRLNWDFGVSISHVEPTQVTAGRRPKSDPLPVRRSMNALTTIIVKSQAH